MTHTHTHTYTPSHPRAHARTLTCTLTHSAVEQLGSEAEATEKQVRQTGPKVDTAVKFYCTLLRDSEVKEADSGSKSLRYA